MSETEGNQAELINSDVLEISIPSDVTFESISSASPAEKMEDPQVTQGSYELTRKKRKSSRNRSSDVQLGSYELDSHKNDSLTISNGLDPMGIELISSTTISSTKTDSEYSDKSVQEIGLTKISREVRNLQKSTNDSKILTDYLNTTYESPRSRRRTPAEKVREPEPELGAEPDTDMPFVPEDINPEDIEEAEVSVEEPKVEKVEDDDEEEEAEEKAESEAGDGDDDEEEEEEQQQPDNEEEEETADDTIEDFKDEIVMKESPKSSHNDGNDSDATMVLPMEPPLKRRKSVSRSRSRSRSTFRSRQKSVAQQMKDEMLLTSDKEEAPDEEDDDRISESSFATNRSIDGRPVNPPPKVRVHNFAHYVCN